MESENTSFSSSLESLSIDELLLITTLLSGYDVARLIFCGGRHINKKLLAGGGVNSLEIDLDPAYPVSFPNLAVYFPKLQSLDIYSSDARWNPRLESLQLENLPSSLTKLRLVSSSSSTHQSVIVSLKPSHISQGQIFPLSNLRSLELTDIHQTASFLPFLTSSLTQLRIYPTIIKANELHLLPSSIIDLSIDIQSHSKSEFCFPPNLERLHLSSSTYRFISALPSTLTDLTMWTSNHSVFLELTDRFPTLPAAITRLEMPIPSGFVCSLPPFLQYIHFLAPVPRYRLEVSKIGDLPQTLHTLIFDMCDFNDDTGEIEKLAQSLPPNLTRLSHIRTRKWKRPQLEKLSKDFQSLLMIAPQYGLSLAWPKGLTAMSFEGPMMDSVPDFALPPSIQTLHVGENVHIIDRMANAIAKSTQLTELILGRLNSPNLITMPSSITFLTLTSNGYAFSEHLNAIMPNLRKLSIRESNNAGWEKCSISWFLALPTSLTYLCVNIGSFVVEEAQSTKMMDPNILLSMSHLDKLQELHLSPIETMTDKHLENLPPRLRHLGIKGAEMKLAKSSIDKLPRSLISLRFPRTTNKGAKETILHVPNLIDIVFGSLTDQ
jgi:hypothetical protein